jgi:hypothetical protein
VFPLFFIPGQEYYSTRQFRRRYAAGACGAPRQPGMGMISDPDQNEYDCNRQDIKNRIDAMREYTGDVRTDF